ncbi:MAG: hypothetical protein LBK60_06525 [Verrucomicrobiales bacterium]|jgi:hypothetical protein|nr:hypothetical protein [Verrucomicrobiales bacterium]
MIHGQIKTIKTNTAVDEFLVTLKEDTRHHDDLKSRLWHLPPDNGSGGADADHYRLLRLGRRGVVAVPIFFAGQRGHVLSLLIAQTDHEDSPSGLPPTWKK